MLYKLTFGVFVVTAQIAAAHACGWLDEKCCDVDAHNPNIGNCIQDRTICWEGQCMMCGVNGKPKCPSMPWIAAASLDVCLHYSNCSLHSDFAHGKICFRYCRTIRTISHIGVHRSGINRYRCACSQACLRRGN